jgi:hypothetical protein
VILASQSMPSLLHGTREGEATMARPIGSSEDAPSLQRQEFVGGIGVEGALALQQFVRNGGTLITFDSAGTLPIQLFPLPIRNLVTSSSGNAPSSYYCPGSLLRIEIDAEHPAALGMPTKAFAFQSGGQAYESTLASSLRNSDRDLKVIARYASKDLLASGWLSGGNTIAGRPAAIEVPYGKGRVVLFGFRPQFRGQTYGTIQLFLNALHLGLAR